MKRCARLLAAGLMVALGGAAESQAPIPSGLSGHVLSIDERPISGGTVTVRFAGTETVAIIDREGRFRVETLPAMSFDIEVASPGFTTQSMRIVMPASRSLVLPPVRLPPAVYARVHLLSPRGDPLVNIPIMRASFHLEGWRIWDRQLEFRPRPDPNDGSILVGPLPRGVTMLGVDAPPLARTRLRDVRVTGETPIINAGRYVVGRGATLRVAVVDRNGEPVTGHDVFLDDGTQMGPFAIPPQKTDVEGVVEFDRLAPGTYRLRMGALERCPRWYPAVQRIVTIAGAEDIDQRVVLDAVKLNLRFTFTGTPVEISSVTIKPDSTPPVMPAWLRDPDPFLALRQRFPFQLDEPWCESRAQGSNRFAFVNVPSGEARVNAVVGTSNWTRKIRVPPNGGDVTLQVHGGLAALRILAADDRAPIPGAAATWQAHGAEVEAGAAASGEVLLQGIPIGPGRMTVRSRGFGLRVREMARPPEILEEVVLERTSTAAWTCRVLDDRGKPIASAVVQLTPNDRMEPPVVTATDAEGIARFIGLRIGAARVLVMATGYATSVEPITLAATINDATVVLKRPGSMP